MFASKELDEKKINATEFLRRVTCRKYKIMPSSAGTGSSSDNEPATLDGESTESIESSDENLPSTSSGLPARNNTMKKELDEYKNMFNCKVCMERMVAIVCEPCNHCALCVPCWEKIESDYFHSVSNNETQRDDLMPKCPICRQGVVSGRRNYF